MHPMEKDRFASAVREMLAAGGLDLEDEELRDTPARVAALWAQEFLAGYQMDPRAILEEPAGGEPGASGTSTDAVFLTGLSFHSLCPHHLLPVRGKAHVAYLPAGRLIGFGRIAQLVACFTQRLTLQERATTAIAQAVMDYLPARGAGCVLEAEHLCLALPGDRHQASRVLSSAFLGEFAERAELRGRLLAQAK